MSKFLSKHDLELLALADESQAYTGARVAMLASRLLELEAENARLKEDGERLASNVYVQIDEDGHTWCLACHNHDDEHTEYCPITLHREMLKELEE